MEEGAPCLNRRAESVSMQEKLHGELHLSNYPPGNGVVHCVHHRPGPLNKAGGCVAATRSQTVGSWGDQ